ncbi:DUF1206 domain-containing protein [Dactylosporangium sp. AC04546]|uniref:DUF1206 domain-containing protein n=1 Tax=Dactylosporangium sp. AC04546 TaxID=2862460 RepID=UPI001EDED4A9|nr:DUF1206 domain-containing protein [Dactylosporangium sp. AC04546]WVK85137.1 DUF1206 domain-containing protein [Dactylosporangium sp. AC04546]
MTAVNTSSPALRYLSRVGFVGYGLLHLALAWVAAQIALGRSGQEGDQSGAFRTLAGQPFGEVLLWFVIVCLVALAIWQAVLAVWGHRDTQGKERLAERVFSAARVVIYLALAFTAGKVVAGAPQSSAEQQQQATAGLMAKPAGEWLVGLIGVAVLAFGIGMLWYGLKRRFLRKLEFGGGRSRSAAIRAGQVGYAAKGVAFGIVGYLLIEAAVKNDPAKSRGLDAALHTVAGQPYGRFLLLAIALGLAAFAVYCLFQARYRKVGS